MPRLVALHGRGALRCHMPATSARALAASTKTCRRRCCRGCDAGCPLRVQNSTGTSSRSLASPRRSQRLAPSDGLGSSKVAARLRGRSAWHQVMASAAGIRVRQTARARARGSIGLALAAVGPFPLAPVRWRPRIATLSHLATSGVERCGAPNSVRTLGDSTPTGNQTCSNRALLTWWMPPMPPHLTSGHQRQDSQTVIQCDF